MKQIREGKLLINGQVRRAGGERTYDNISPWTGESIGRAADASAADVDAAIAADASTADVETAIAAARQAFDSTDWSVQHRFRLKVLSDFYDQLCSHREELIEIAMLEAGASLGTAYSAQVDGALKGAADLLDAFEKVRWEEDRGIRNEYGFDTLRTVMREAAGVVAAITPWNVPLYINIGKCFGALLAGCTVVLKPAPDTPVMGAIMGELAVAAGLPAGVFNVVTSSDPAMAGEMLTRDPRVDLISFTGSTAVGKHIMEAGAATLKRVFLELGGKSAFIVLDGAEGFEQMVAGAMLVFHAGQGCAAPTRLLVPRSRYEEAVAILDSAYHSYDDQWGNFDQPTCLMGPLVSQRQRDRVLGYIDIGVKEGARLLAGGKARPDKGSGFFVEPTCFVDVDNSMRIAQEEIFGPVLVVIPFDDDDDAIRIANDSIYGLGGYVFGPPERAMGVARRIRAGAICVNGGMSIAGDLPFGGYKQSGVGREWGREGIEEFTELKAVGMRVS